MKQQEVYKLILCLNWKENEYICVEILDGYFHQGLNERIMYNGKQNSSF